MNNAGISPFYKRVEHTTAEDLDQLMGVNLRGAWCCSIEVATRLFEMPGSPAASSTSATMLGIHPDERQGAYGVTKAGLIHMAKVFALEWADRGVRVNALAPGWTESALTGWMRSSRAATASASRATSPSAATPTPEDTAGAALYLIASEASSYVTGAVHVTIDGGRSLR